MSEIIRSWAEAIIYDVAATREREIRLALQPRPKWLPKFLWRRAVARLLVIEEHGHE